MASEARPAGRRNDHRAGHRRASRSVPRSRRPAGSRSTPARRPAASHRRHSSPREARDELAQIGERAVRAVPDVDLVEAEPRGQLVHRGHSSRIRGTRDERRKPLDVDPKHVVGAVLVRRRARRPAAPTARRASPSPHRSARRCRSLHPSRSPCCRAPSGRPPRARRRRRRENSSAPYAAPDDPVCPEHGEDQVLPCRLRPGLPHELDPDRLRHPHPDLAEREGGGDVGRAEAEAERTERPVRARMGVAARRSAAPGAMSPSSGRSVCSMPASAVRPSS